MDYLARHSSASESAVSDRAEDRRSLSRLLHSRSLLVRFSTAVVLGLAAMFMAWAVGYLFLPEGMLRGKTAAGAVSEHASGLSTFVLALVWNGAVAFVVVPLVSLLAVRHLSLGYVLVIGHYALFGVFLGTNSFAIPKDSPAPPSLSVFLGTGPWEIGAYLLVASALAQQYRFNQIRWLGIRVERIRTTRPRLALGEWLAIAMAAITISTAAWIEHKRVENHSNAFLQPATQP